MAASTDSPQLVEFHEQLAREIRDDPSDMIDFQTEHGFVPYFHTYYKNWLGDERRLRRSRNGAIIRRRDLPGFVDRLKAQCGPHPRIVDVGCGFGSDSLFLAWLGCEVVGVDPSERMIAVSAYRAERWREFLGNNAPTPQFLVGRLEDVTSLDPATFDAGFASECLHHCEPVENTLLALRGLVRDSGRVFVLESNGGGPANEILLRKRRSKHERRLFRKNDAGFYIHGNENIRPARTWKRLFHDCGFNVEDTRYSRHLLNEASGEPLLSDEFLSRLPGASLATIHVTFELTPRPVDTTVG